MVYSKAFQTEPVTGLMIIKKANFFNHETNITAKCTFSENNNKKLPVRTYVSTGMV